MKRRWVAVEYDPNMGRVIDYVTEDFAAGLRPGDRIVAVCLDHRTVTHHDHDWQVLDDGFAVMAEIIELARSDKWPGQVMLRAKLIHGDIEEM